jgi:putative transposase
MRHRLFKTARFYAVYGSERIFEILNSEVFYSLREMQILIETGSKHHNTKRTQSALGCRPPAPESIKTIDQKPTMQ